MNKKWKEEFNMRALINFLIFIIIILIILATVGALTIYKKVENLIENEAYGLGMNDNEPELSNPSFLVEQYVRYNTI